MENENKKSRMTGRQREGVVSEGLRPGMSCGLLPSSSNQKIMNSLNLVDARVIDVAVNELVIPSQRNISLFAQRSNRHIRPGDQF